MATLSAVPVQHDLKMYAGDTYTLEIRAPAEVTDGMEWHAQIRTTKDSPIIDATFSITVPEVSGGPAYITLLSADSARLASGAPLVTRRSVDGIVRTVQEYSGVFDCHVRHPTLPDPVRSLVQGAVSIELNVTRPE
jgi:hypothetical protein